MKSLRSRGIPVPHVEDPRDSVALDSLFRQLQQHQAQAKALGIFTDERNLLTCPNCGLFEDVNSDGFLITSRTLSKEPLDTGLRFSEIAPGTYYCPSCQSVVPSPNDIDEQVDSKAPMGRPYNSRGHRPGSNAPIESGALKGRNNGGVHDRQTKAGRTLQTVRQGMDNQSLRFFLRPSKGIRNHQERSKGRNCSRGFVRRY